MEKLKKEIEGYEAELRTHREKVRLKKEAPQPLYEAWLEFCVHVNQRQIARMSK